MRLPGQPYYKNMKHRSLVVALLVLCSLSTYADEGMWMLGNMSK